MKAVYVMGGRSMLRVTKVCECFQKNDTGTDEEMKTMKNHASPLMEPTRADGIIIHS